MNLASVVVLGLVAVWAVYAVIRIRKKDTGGCGGDCGGCTHSCSKADRRGRT